MSKLLSDLIRHFLMMSRSETGSYDIEAVRRQVQPMLSEDQREQMIGQTLVKAIKEIATKARRSAGLSGVYKRSSESTIPDMFPELDAAYSTSDKIVTDTDDLTQMEMRRLIEAREQQLLDDGHKLDVLKVAYNAAYPIWAEHPNWTFGQCKAELYRRNGNGKSKRGK